MTAKTTKLHCHWPPMELLGYLEDLLMGVASLPTCLTTQQYVQLAWQDPDGVSVVGLFASITAQVTHWSCYLSCLQGPGKLKPPCRAGPWIRIDFANACHMPGEESMAVAREKRGAMHRNRALQPSMLGRRLDRVL